jgi:hypothetical protein
MRHVPISVFAIVAIVGVAVMMFSFSSYDVPTLLAVQFTQAPTSTGNTVIARLEIGEFLSNKVTGLSDVQMPGLRSTVVQTEGGRADAYQSLRFAEPGIFTGGQALFGRTEDGVTSDYLQFNDGVFKYQIDFSPGLESKVEGGELSGLLDEDIFILGETFTIVDASTSGNGVVLRLFGGYGSIEFRDDNYLDNNYQQFGGRVNGESVNARVMIKAQMVNNMLQIYSIQYILAADAKQGGELQVLPLHCTREYLKYPTGLLSPQFDICYKGTGGAIAPTTKGISGNQVLVKARGDDEYTMIASNIRGQVYEIPLAQMPGMYGNNGHDFVFIEAPNSAAPNINEGDYFLVSSRNQISDVNAVSNVLRFDNVQNNVAYFQDLAGGSRQATFDAGTGQGTLNVGEGSYTFFVGAGNALAMDQTNDGNINGGEATWRFPGGTMADFGPGFTVKIITPRRLFDDYNADEITDFDITFGGGQIDLFIPSPQAPIFELISESGGTEQGLTKFGILWTLSERTKSDDLKLIIPGSYSPAKGGAGAEVFITLDRPALMKESPSMVPAVCGDRIISPGEYCDPPGSPCAGTGPFERGVCAANCKTCAITPRAVCGDGKITSPETCEVNADCPAGKWCDSCQCVGNPVCGNGVKESGEMCESNAQCGAGLMCYGCLCIPPPVCGNNLIEPGEMCEKNVDCPNGQSCSGCQCVSGIAGRAGDIGEVQGNVFTRFWSWFKGLFGRA